MDLKTELEMEPELIWLHWLGPITERESQEGTSPLCFHFKYCLSTVSRHRLISLVTNSRQVM